MGQTLPAPTKALEHVGVLLSSTAYEGGTHCGAVGPLHKILTDTYGVPQSYFKRFFRIGLETKQRL